MAVSLKSELDPVLKFSDLQVLIFDDDGVTKESVEAIDAQLRDILDRSISIYKVDGNYLRTQPWEEKTISLFMGGGICKVWDERLGKEGIDKIRRFVLNGGKYIGFCAGAYFASAESIFEVKDLPPIERKRELGFFQGKAVGPIVQTYNPLSVDSAQAAKVSLVIDDKKQKGYLYYLGGCFFELDERSFNAKIIAQYKNLAPNKAAAIECAFGKGTAFLCGLHPEFVWTEDLTYSDHPTFAKLAKILSSQESFRKQIWEEIKKIIALQKA